MTTEAPEPELPQLDRVLGWNVTQWARAIALVRRHVRLPVPNISGAVHAQLMWRRFYHAGADMTRAGDDLLGTHGWVYLMFAAAAHDVERLQRLSGKT